MKTVSNWASLLKYRRESLAGDLAGGLATAVVAVPHCLPLGVIAFAPLGPDYAGLGAAAGLVSSIVAGIVTGLFGSSRILVGGPRVSSALLMAATLSVLIADPALSGPAGPDVPRILALLFLYVILAGALQVGFGLFRFGTVIKYIPYPVIAGFMNGVALLIIAGQYKNVLGLPHEFEWQGLGLLLEAAQPGALLIAVVTIASVWICRRYFPRLPVLIIGVFAGCALFFGISLIDGGDKLGGVVGDIPDGLPMPHYASIIFGDLIFRPENWAATAHVLPAIGVLALMASVESLLSALSADTLTGERHDANRELIGQGLANIACGLFGAVPSAGATTRSVACYQAGGRTPLAAIVHSLILLTALVVGGGIFGMVPEAVLGGVMVFLAWSMFDDWSRQLFVKFARVGRNGGRGDIAANLTVVVLVFGVTVLVSPIVAVGLGVLASMVLFVRSMSKSIVRRVGNGANRRSLRIRDEGQTAFLAEHGRAILVAELDGPLFFGAGDQLTRWAAALPDHIRYVIFDFRRVSEVDATGARLVAQLAKDFAGRGGQVALAHLDSSADAIVFHDMGVDAVVPRTHWFRDADHALEWAEDELLRAEFGEEVGGELPLAELPVFVGCGSGVVSAISEKMVRRQLQAYEALFREGDAGTELYFVVGGRIDVELRLDDDGSRTRRLSTVGPGAVLGEMALFAGKARSADAVAATDVTLYALSESAFRALLSEQPEAATTLLMNIGRELSARLAVTNQELRMVES